MKKYEWVCAVCGSNSVTCSGNLHWDYALQQWVFDGDPLDDDFCADCEDETTLIQKFDEDSDATN